jgi:hypothetical protein
MVHGTMTCGHEEYRTDMQGETAIAVCCENMPCPIHEPRAHAAHAELIARIDTTSQERI